MTDLTTPLGGELDHVIDTLDDPGWDDAPPWDDEGNPPPPDDRSFGEHYPDEPALVIVNGRHLRDVTRDLLDAVHHANSPPCVFVRGGQLTRVRQDERGRPIVEPMTTDQIRGRIARTADTYRITQKGDTTAVPPPLDSVRDIVALGDWPMPPLEAVTEIPTLRPDGTINHQPGYDTATRLLHIPAPGLCVPAVPDRPSPLELQAAVELLDEALHDFPFDTDADRANAIGFLLTPIARPAISGQVPLALVDAPEPGTGKGLLVHLAAVIATGRTAVMRPLAVHDDEIRKMITATLAEGPTIIALDNVEDSIRSPSLALALTSDDWADRILGRSETVKLPNRATWVATGNNLSVGGDLARRCYRIRLDARTAKPYNRAASSFRHPDLLGWAAERRGDLIAALLTIARHWYSSGQPDIDVPAIGGFTPWARQIGGILHTAGIDGFLTNLVQFHSEADRDADDWGVFLVAWRDQFGARLVTASELADACDPTRPSPLLRSLPGEIAVALGRGGFTKTLGRHLMNKKGRHYGDEGIHITERGKSRTGGIRWAVEYADEALPGVVLPIAVGADHLADQAFEAPGTGSSGPPEAQSAGLGTFAESLSSNAQTKSPENGFHMRTGAGNPANSPNPAPPEHDHEQWYATDPPAGYLDDDQETP